MRLPNRIKESRKDAEAERERREERHNWNGYERFGALVSRGKITVEAWMWEGGRGEKFGLVHSDHSRHASRKDAGFYEAF